MTGWLLIGLSALGSLVTVLVMLGLVLKSRNFTTDLELQGLTKPDDLASYPKVSIVVPVRNEERNIRRCLSTLLAFDYPSFEILTADDGSTDKTMEIVAELAKAAPEGRVRVFSTPKGEPGERETWRSGKAWVLHNAARQATGQWVLFVDADTYHKPDGLWRVMTIAKRHGLEALSASGVYVNPGFLGELQEAVIYTAIVLAMPLRKINDAAERHLGWANGQFILFERGCYERVGGHKAVQPFTQDDMAIGRLVKERGAKYRFLPAALLFDCVNYVGLGEAHRGWVRLLASGTPWLGIGRLTFVAMILGLLFATVLPPLLAVAAYALNEPLALQVALGQLGFVTLVHALIRGSMKNPIWRAIFVPVGGALALFTLIGGWRQRFSAGAIDLRGRRLVIDDEEIRKVFAT
jgi:chlorobactene glucosyltransferase